jgi:hypothetical protein
VAVHAQGRHAVLTGPDSAAENLRRFDWEGRPRWHSYGHAIVCGVLAVWHTWRDVIATAWKKGA